MEKMELRARAGAGPRPNHVHKRKHQIGSLVFEAQQREAEAWDKRATAVKSKGSTRRKYGW